MICSDFSCSCLRKFIFVAYFEFHRIFLSVVKILKSKVKFELCSSTITNKNAFNLRLTKKIIQHSASLYAASYSEKLDLLFTGGADKIVASWNPNNYENTNFSIKTQSAVLNLNVINEQHLFIGLFNGHFHIIDLDSKKEIKFITKHKKGIYASCINSKNKYLLVGSGDGALSIWDTEKFELVLEQKICEGKIRAIATNNDLAYIGTSDGKLLVVNLLDLTLIKSIQINDEGLSSIVHLTEKNALLLGGKNAWLYIFEESKSKVIHSFPAHNWAIYQLCQNDNYIFSASRDKVIKQWDKKTLGVVDKLCWPEHKGHTHSINNLLFINKHNTLVSVGDDKAICFWK